MIEMTNKILDGVINFFAVIAGILLATMALIVTYNVIMRYFVNRPPVWAIETTEYIMVYATFLAAAWVLKHGGHVKIDIILVMLSKKRQHALNVLVCILGIVACGLLAWYGMKATYSLYSREVIMMKMMPWPKWVLVAPIPIGILLTFIQFIRKLIGLIATKEAAE
jgi:TRAP-type C4-dicarboxylate transport system permease small subunit